MAHLDWTNIWNRFDMWMDSNTEKCDECGKKGHKPSKDEQRSYIMQLVEEAVNG